MLSEKILKNLTSSDIELLGAEDMKNPVAIARITELAEDPMFDLEPGEALDFYESLDQLIKKNSENLMDERDLYDKWAAVLWSMMWKALPALDKQARYGILGHNLVFSLRHNVDIKFYLQKLLNITEFGLGPDDAERKGFIRILEDSVERLGQGFIDIKGEGKEEPTVQNWLTDYISSFPNSPRRGKLEQINYMNSNSNAKQLGTEERDVLGKILAVYDWLKYPPVVADFGNLDSADDQGNTVIPNRKQETFSTPRSFAPQATRVPQAKVIPPPPLPPTRDSAMRSQFDKILAAKLTKPAVPPIKFVQRQDEQKPQAVKPKPTPPFAAPTPPKSEPQRTSDAEIAAQDLLTDIRNNGPEPAQAQGEPGPRLSVNEAIIRAGQATHGIGRGGIESGEKTEVNDRLKELRDKLESTGKDGESPNPPANALDAKKNEGKPNGTI